VILADRYVYTPMARAEARGLERAWLRELFGFAVAPDGVLFLDADATTTIARREARPLDPYEGGFDLHLSSDAREAYRLFQDRLYACFLGYAEDFAFARVAATGSIAQVQRRLERAAAAVLDARAPH
jgi:dTMP kinase